MTQAGLPRSEIAVHADLGETIVVPQGFDQGTFRLSGAAQAQRSAAQAAFYALLEKRGIIGFSV
jgi:hypothetical protein